MHKVIGGQKSHCNSKYLLIYKGCQYTTCIAQHPKLKKYLWMEKIHIEFMLRENNVANYYTYIYIYTYMNIYIYIYI